MMEPEQSQAPVEQQRTSTLLGWLGTMGFGNEAQEPVSAQPQAVRHAVEMPAEPVEQENPFLGLEPVAESQEQPQDVEAPLEPQEDNNESKEQASYVKHALDLFLALFVVLALAGVGYRGYQYLNAPARVGVATPEPEEQGFASMEVDDAVETAKEETKSFFSNMFDKTKEAASEAKTTVSAAALGAKAKVEEKLDAKVVEKKESETDSAGWNAKEMGSKLASGARKAAELAKKGAAHAKETAGDLKSGFVIGAMSAEEQMKQKIDAQKAEEKDFQCGKQCGKSYRDHKLVFFIGALILTAAVAGFFASFFMCCPPAGSSVCLETPNCGGIVSTLIFVLIGALVMHQAGRVETMGKSVGHCMKETCCDSKKGQTAAKPARRRLIVADDAECAHCVYTIPIIGLVTVAILFYVAYKYQERQNMAISQDEDEIVIV